MELIDAVRTQHPALFSGDTGGNEFARFGFVIKAIKQISQPFRHACAGHSTKLFHRIEVCHRQNARHDRHVNAPGTGLVLKPQENIDVEKVLRDGAGRTGIDFHLKAIDILFHAARFGMGFGKARDADLEITDLFEALDEITGMQIPVRVGPPGRPLIGWITPQSHDMANTFLPIRTGDLFDLAT